MKDDKNNPDVERNSYLYRKYRQKEFRNIKMVKNMDTTIRKLSDNGNISSEGIPIINMTQALKYYDDS